MRFSNPPWRAAWERRHYASIRQEFDRRVRAGEFREVAHNGAGQQFTTTGMIRMEREIIARMQEGNRRGYNDPLLVSPQVRNSDRRPAPGTERRATQRRGRPIPLA